MDDDDFRPDPVIIADAHRTFALEVQQMVAEAEGYHRALQANEPLSHGDVWNLQRLKQCFPAVRDIVEDNPTDEGVAAVRRMLEILDDTVAGFMIRYGVDPTPVVMRGAERDVAALAAWRYLGGAVLAAGATSQDAEGHGVEDLWASPAEVADYCDCILRDLDTGCVPIPPFVIRARQLWESAVRLGVALGRSSPDWTHATGIQLFDALAHVRDACRSGGMLRAADGAAARLDPGPADRRAEPPTAGGQPDEPATPHKLLTSWREITDALDLQHADQDKVRSLNGRYGGPIPKPGKGGQPIVRRDSLLNWWNRLALLQQEKANIRDGAELSVEAQHGYGSNGTTVPEIDGSVKNRRADTKR
jgi:hypothetical protein